MDTIERMPKTYTKTLGYVAVDAGMLMITDPGYLYGWENNEMGDAPAGHYSWAGACATTIDNDDRGGELTFKAGHSGAGVVFRSGIGDGYYPVIAHYANFDDWGKRIVKIEILMIEEE